MVNGSEVRGNHKRDSVAFGLQQAGVIEATRDRGDGKSITEPLQL